MNDARKRRGRSVESQRGTEPDRPRSVKNGKAHASANPAPTKVKPAASIRKPAAAGVAVLQTGLTGDRALAGASYMEKPELLRAYLEYYWPVSHAQALHALRVSIPSLASTGFDRFRTVIDAGSGPGPVAAAFASLGCESLVLVDSSRKALDLACSIISERSAVTDASPSISTVCMDIADPDPSKIPGWGQADCVSFGHSLNEIASGKPDRIEKRVSVLERWAGALSPAEIPAAAEAPAAAETPAAPGFMLIIEPALLSTSRDLLEVRNILVSRGWRVLAPCIGRSGLPCPAFGAGPSHTCHTDVRWDMSESVARIAASLGISKDTLKMTWFLLQPPRSMPSAAGDRAAAVETPAAPAVADGPYACRIVSEPMLNKSGRLRRLICGEKGRFPLSVASGSPECERTAFDFLVRGELVVLRECESRDSGWGIGSRTQLERPEADAIANPVRSAPINMKNFGPNKTPTKRKSR